MFIHDRKIVRRGARFDLWNFLTELPRISLKLSREELMLAEGTGRWEQHKIVLPLEALQKSRIFRTLNLLDIALVRDSNNLDVFIDSDVFSYYK